MKHVAPRMSKPKHIEEGAKIYYFQKRKALKDLESKKKTSMMSNIITTTKKLGIQILIFK